MNRKKYGNKNHPAGMEGLKFLHGQMYRYRRYSIALPLLACLSQVSQSLLLLLLPKIVLDAVTGGAGFAPFAASVLRVGVGLAAAAVLNLVFHNEIEKCSQTFLFRRLNALWERKMLRLDYGVFCSKQGKIGMEKARAAIASPNWGVVELPGKEAALLEAGAGLAAYCAIVGTLHPAILVFLGLFFLVEMAAGIWIEERKQGFKEEKARADRRLNYIAYGTRGMKEAKDIRIFSMTGMLKEITEEVIRGKNAVEAKVLRWQFLRAGITALLIFVRNGLACLFLIERYLEGGMTVGDFSLYFGAIAGIGMWLTKLSEAVSGFREAENFVRDFYGFLALPEDGTAEGADLASGAVRREGREMSECAVDWDGPDKGVLPECAGTKPQGAADWDGPERAVLPEGAGIKPGSPASHGKCTGKPGGTGRAVSFILEDISFSYRKWEDGEEREVPIFRNLDLTIRAGERLAIVGRNGAGKSTLVKLLCGMLEPNRGRILMDGRDIRSIPKEELYGHFSAVFQHSRILPVSVARNVMLDVREREDKDAMWEAIRAAGLEEKVKSLPSGEETGLVGQISEEGTELSGGQEQRLLLARALYKAAPVLLLDEPTAALDSKAESEIYEKYGELTEGKTSVFVSHRLASTRFCDRILFIEEGRIAESGSHLELMEKNGRYADMFRVQSRYYRDQERLPAAGCGAEEAPFAGRKEGDTDQAYGREGGEDR